MAMLPCLVIDLRNVLSVFPYCSLCANNQPFHSAGSCSQSHSAVKYSTSAHIFSINLHFFVFLFFFLLRGKCYKQNPEAVALTLDCSLVYLEGGILFTSWSGIEKRWRPPSLLSLHLINVRCGLLYGGAAAYVKIHIRSLLPWWFSCMILCDEAFWSVHVA